MSVCEEDFCRNGVYEPSIGEVCDDGNNIDDDGCSNECRHNNGFQCISFEGKKSDCEPIRVAVLCRDDRIPLDYRVPILMSQALSPQFLNF